MLIDVQIHASLIQSNIGSLQITETGVGEFIALFFKNGSDALLEQFAIRPRRRAHTDLLARIHVRSARGSTACRSAERHNCGQGRDQSRFNNSVHVPFPSEQESISGIFPTVGFDNKGHKIKKQPVCYMDNFEPFQQTSGKQAF